ncbi:DnaJ domain-containing protein [Hyphomicrobium sp. xq]|uniref:DnaJ domain-containing protein n=1 Tax=Hyphomicrobium album TaxID=2665159 RepID=A0A6I3KFV1_9HYPH|nr:DnaJ domain-containing protein [Hyphomicrobium album]MTD93784.1 DnaJ domain-containing protein [Hyphomicrobium album]
MLYLVLGLIALALGLIAMRSFAQANPANVARRLRIGGGAVSLFAASLLMLRGLEVLAIPLGMFGSWLIWGRTLPPWLGGGGSARRSPGQTSRIETDHLEMELDHDTGEMHGRVLKGMFAGRDIDTLSPTDLGLLWQDCRHTDLRSAQLVEAYLDRIHPTWREDMARGESDMSRGPDGRMTEKEALEILGLKPGADEEDIRRAHRELMLRLHPDRGGSTYLAAKINEAKDVALDALR